jgi:hypothetical protein
MSKRKQRKTSQPEIKRLDQLEAECQTIIARFRREDCQPAAYDEAVERVNDAIPIAALEILQRRFGQDAAPMAENASQLWWLFMTKPDGGFSRYDRSRPFVPYGFSTLKWICLGRENSRDHYDRRMTARDQSDGRRDPFEKSSRRKASLAFDPIDPDSTDQSLRQRALIQAVEEMLGHLPEGQREVLSCVIWKARICRTWHEHSASPHEPFTCASTEHGKRCANYIRGSPGRRSC